MKQQIDPGTARIGPRRRVVAGERVTLVHTYTAGHPVDDTGYVKIAFRYAGDFGRPQFDDPSAPDFCSVTTTGDCRIIPRWDEKGNTRPWGAALLLMVRAGYLDRGETVTVVFGDTSGGSPGWRMQTFCEKTFEFKTLVDPVATYRFKELPESPTVRIVPGPPARAVCIAPSTVIVGESFDCRLKLEDAWGNPVRAPRRVRRKGFDAPGVETVVLTDEKTGLSATSNPVRVLPAAPPVRPFWADFHGQSEETIGTNSIDDWYAFARDTAVLDIAAHQGNDFQITDEFWRTVNDTARTFDEPGRFVTFPGYEWSGNTPLGGDRNIYYAGEGGVIVHSCCDLLPGEETRDGDIAPTADELFGKLSGPEPFAFAHVGGRYADVAMHDDDIELAMEIHSAWGTFEWLVEDALRRGYHIGICANSDGHKGRPGASHPGAGKFGSYGGLTCVLAERLDRPSVRAALGARRFYATTGCRALLDVRLRVRDDAHMMGEVVSVPEGTEPVLSVACTGTGPLERIDVLDCGTPLRTWRPTVNRESPRVKVFWSGAEVRGRARMCVWDGGLRVAGNRIVAFEPVDFFNPARTVVRESASALSWESITTGGGQGVVLTLDRPDAGTLTVKTAQKSMTAKLASLRKRTRDCGGLRKRIDMLRLPDPPPPATAVMEIPLRDLDPGEHPVYVRMTQEDGHMAWSSPIFIRVE